MSFFADLLSYVNDEHEAVTAAFTEHVWLALVPVALAFVVSLPLSVAVVRWNWVRPAALMLTSVVYTIPSLALFLVLPQVLGTPTLSSINVVVALSLYSTALLVRTTADALGAVDDQVTDAARAMGYTTGREWWQVRFPLALPVILAGVRVAAVANVSMVSMGAFVGLGGLGQLFTTGFNTTYLPPIVVGLVLSVALALVVDFGIVQAQRVLTPWTRVTVSR